MTRCYDGNPEGAFVGHELMSNDVLDNVSSNVAFLACVNIIWYAVDLGIKPIDRSWRDPTNLSSRFHGYPLISCINSARTSAFSLNTPVRLDVTMTECCLLTPRQDMHRCLASSTQALPRGLR